MKRLIALVTIFLVAAQFAGCKKAPEGESEIVESVEPVQSEFAELPQTRAFNILMPLEYIPPDIITDFEREFKITATVDTYTRKSEMDAKMTNGVIQYDIILCEAEFINAMREQGDLIQKLETARLVNYANINPAYQSRYFDPQNEYSVPFAAGCTVLAYNTRTFGRPPSSYNALTTNDLTASVVMPDNMRDTLGAALIMAGASVNATDEQSLMDAGAKLLSIKPNVLSFNSQDPYDMVMSGSARLGLMRNDQVYLAMEMSPSIMYAFPREGVALWIDGFVLAENAPNPLNAYRFLDYVLEAKKSAEISVAIGRTNCTTTARMFLPDYYVENEAINIPDDIATDAQMYESLGKSESMYEAIWDAFKTYQ
jgi:spermidine/putrescine transport system substrate-binding protein